MAHLIWQKKTHLEVKTVKKIKSEKGDGNIDIPRVSYSGQDRSSPEVQWNTVSTTARPHWG